MLDGRGTSDDNLIERDDVALGEDEAVTNNRPVLVPLDDRGQLTSSRLGAAVAAGPGGRPERWGIHHALPHAAPLGTSQKHGPRFEPVEAAPSAAAHAR